MRDQPSEDQAREWHRRFAVEANNRAWTLSEKADLTAPEKKELLYAAYAAAHHWSRVGREENFARAQLLLGRVHAILGHGALAIDCATEAFNSITSRQSERWEEAFAHAVLANAAAVSGNSELHATHYERARALGEQLEDQEDKGIFLATFRLIPTPAQSAADLT
jgi:hypothetical protein